MTDPTYAIDRDPFEWMQGGDETPELVQYLLASLSCNRRAEDSDKLPPDGDRRGAWFDTYGRHKLGSRLWLLYNEPPSTAVAARAKQYAAEALAWMVTEGLADSIDTEAQLVRGRVYDWRGELLPSGAVYLTVTVNRKNEPNADYRFGLLWEGLNP